MKMNPVDVQGALYSQSGLRFGGFTTFEFYEETDVLETKREGVRQEIIAESHFLVYWLHYSSEIAFLAALIISKSMWWSLAAFAGAFILEIVRFNLLGASSLLSRCAALWQWVRFPLFALGSIVLWREFRIEAVSLLVFSVIQGFWGIVGSVAMLPIRLPICRLIYVIRGSPWHNLEAVTVALVVQRWKHLLFPSDGYKTTNFS